MPTVHQSFIGMQLLETATDAYSAIKSAQELTAIGLGSSRRFCSVCIVRTCLVPWQ